MIGDLGGTRRGEEDEVLREDAIEGGVREDREEEDELFGDEVDGGLGPGPRID